MNQVTASQSAQIIHLLSDDRELLINSILAIITLLALLVAFFQESIKKLLSRAKIKISINKFPPDCHQILLTNQQTGKPVGYTIYSRIRLANKSKINTSEDTEVFIAHFWKIVNGEKEEVKTFLPMNLKWSHTHEIKTNILPDFYRYCDFGSFRKRNNGDVILLIDTIVQPNPVSGGKLPNLIEAGDYEFEIVVSGKNIKPQKKVYNLSFENEWKENEEEMLSSISIEEKKHI